MPDPRRRLAIAALAVLVGGACTPDDELSPTPTSTSIPADALIDAADADASTSTTEGPIPATEEEQSPEPTVTTSVAPPRDRAEPNYPTTPPRPTPSYPDAGR